jgi:hypothetical protein
MLRRYFLLTAISAIATTMCRTSVASTKATANVIDAMPAFWRFWDTTAHQPDDVRVRAFFDTVVAAYPDLFHHGLIASGALTDLGDVAEVQIRVSKYLRDVTPYIPTMRRVTSEIHKHFSRYVDDFSATFPDYAPTTPVYFTVSLFGFSGGMNFSGESTGLYFGIDEIARTLESTDALKILIQHELFHRYHFQIAPEIAVDRAAWAYMWEEGLATYVSKAMSPGSTADQALVIPPHLSVLAEPHLRELAERFLEQPDSTDATAVGEMFLQDKAPAGMPMRSGYYLGLRVAELLGADRSLNELAHLQGHSLRQAVLTALARLRNAA